MLRVMTLRFPRRFRSRSVLRDPFPGTRPIASDFRIPRPDARGRAKSSAADPSRPAFVAADLGQTASGRRRASPNECRLCPRLIGPGGVHEFREAASHRPGPKESPKPCARPDHRPALFVRTQDLTPRAEADLDRSPRRLSVRSKTPNRSDPVADSRTVIDFDGHLEHGISVVSSCRMAIPVSPTGCSQAHGRSALSPSTMDSARTARGPPAAALYPEGDTNYHERMSRETRRRRCWCD